MALTERRQVAGIPCSMQYVICVPHCRGLTQDAKQQLAEQCACQGGALEPQVGRAAERAGGGRWGRGVVSGRGRRSCCSLVLASRRVAVGQAQSMSSGRTEQQARRPTRQGQMGCLPGQLPIILGIIHYSKHWGHQGNDEEVVCISVKPRAWF